MPNPPPREILDYEVECGIRGTAWIVVSATSKADAIRQVRDGKYGEWGDWRVQGVYPRKAKEV